jgi:hypothetical protein
MAELDTSETTLRANTQGKECKIGRFLTEDEGWKIVKIAETWEGTPYALVGKNSIKGTQGDCSGSSYKIYEEAGFPYPYQTSATIVPFINATHRFRKLSGQGSEAPQAGDLIVWPGGHIAIYTPFKDGDPRAINKYGKKNDMWSAHYPRGPAYGADRAQGFRRNETYEYYRYFLLPGDPGCP